MGVIDEVEFTLPEFRKSNVSHSNNNQHEIHTDRSVPVL